MGAPGEIDEDGVIRKISVVPPPYQDPYPQTLQSFSISPSTIEFAAKNNSIPFILQADPAGFRQLCELYQRVSAEEGREMELGQQVGAQRAIHLGDTEEEATQLLYDTHYTSWRDYFGGFGFWDSLRLPGDEEKWPMDPFTPLPKSEWTIDRMRKTTYSIAGTPDQVKRGIENLNKVHGEEGNLEWLSWYFDQGLMGSDEAVRQLEMFAEHVMPEFKD
jgi:alkanesulfonate monooxygenase SsuD/methylene tetrahydromethanopterin reductase-like flavin-dependent oxidoreductase (luciferase family)